MDKSNPGSWGNVFADFRVSATFESRGKLDYLLRTDLSKYANVFIDEAHAFRNETNSTYEKLAEICRGKRIVLVSATPYNNTAKDILSLLKLFQNSKMSTIPNMPDLETFFNNLDKKLADLDRKDDWDKYVATVKEKCQ